MNIFLPVSLCHSVPPDLPVFLIVSLYLLLPVPLPVFLHLPMVSSHFLFLCLSVLLPVFTPESLPVYLLWHPVFLSRSHSLCFFPCVSVFFLSIAFYT